MEDETYLLVKKNVRSLLNINLDYYKDQQVRRRLDYWLVRVGEKDWAGYFRRMQSDNKELGRFRDYLTINVSKFFRDPERWQLLRDRILPPLLSQNGNGALDGFRIWSAGCSIGAEPYTLAMIMDEIAPKRRYTLLATDLDRGALAISKAGGPYSAEDIDNVTPAQRSAYFKSTSAPFYMQDRMVKQITFREQDMVLDRFDTNFDLIVCRNVVIYFTAETKTELYKKFHASLKPGGILFLGGTEIIPQPQEIGFRSLGVSFYQKAA